MSSQNNTAENSSAAVIAQLKNVFKNGTPPAKIRELIHDLTTVQRSCYERQSTMLPPGITVPSFDELQRYWLPTPEQDGTFLIFDLEQGIIDPRDTTGDIFRANDPFSDRLTATIDSYQLFQEAIEDSQEGGRRSYLIIGDPRRFWALLQIPVNEQKLKSAHFFADLEAMTAYFSTNACYLPWRITADHQESARPLYKTLALIHQQRITPSGRRGDNVLLTIAIPSYNRGHRALNGAKELLKSHFDEEIEILVSNNASEKYQEEYQAIAALPDARITYHQNASNLGYIGNILKVLNRARGKFIMIMSDEDTVRLENLEGLLAKLHHQEERLAWLRTSTDSKKYPAGYFQRGHDAITKGILQNNYISGAVYNTAMFRQSGAEEYLHSRPDNEACIIYPHMVIDTIMTMYGDVAFSPLQSCANGAEENDTPASGLLRWQSPEGRQKQHQGFAEVFIDAIKKYQIPQPTAEEMLLQLMRKTGNLLYMNISRDARYNFKPVYFNSIMELYRNIEANIIDYQDKLGYEPSEACKDKVQTTFIQFIQKADSKPKQGI